MENIIMHIYKKKMKSKNPKCSKNVFCSQMRFLFSTKPQKQNKLEVYPFPFLGNLSYCKKVE